MISGAGLGFRRDMVDEFDQFLNADIQFCEVAPENWMRLGGKYREMLTELSNKIPLSTHGLSLSIGSPDPLDTDFVEEVGQFLDRYKVVHYTEHLSYCSATGHMYDLMPIPFTKEAVDHVANRIIQVQDILQRQIAVENVSYYLAPGQEMSEIEFTQRVLEKADCKLLFDVNNVYVNSINHQYDAKSFVDAMPTDRILYGHIAGHYDEAEDLKVDTHGADVKDDVWQLLRYAYQVHGVFPTLLERDFNVPPIATLIKEVEMITELQRQAENGNVARV